MQVSFNPVAWEYSSPLVLEGYIPVPPLDAWNCESVEPYMYNVFFYTYVPFHLKEALYDFSLACPNSQPASLLLYHYEVK